MNPYKVLVVEDDPIQAQALSIMLKRQGHEVVGTARSGERALTLFEDTKPDLVFLDINIVGQLNDGIEVGRRMMAQRPTPQIYLSGYPEFMGEPQLTDDTAFFPKPFNLNDLEEVIQTAIRNFLQHSSNI
jgi:two-component SAPR family response regulator